VEVDQRRALIRLHFEGGFDERGEAEALDRGYRGHVWAELADGSMHPLSFYDVTRLSQTLASESAVGRTFFTEPGLVVVAEVTLANMQAAARTLAEEGFFIERTREG